MRHNLIQIEDTKGRKFHIEVRTPGFSERGLIPFVGFDKGRHQGYWRVINLSFLRYTEGDAFRKESGAMVNASADLWIGLPGQHDLDTFDWGIKLHQYDNSFGTKDIGTGELKQAWVLGAAPGMIRWRRPNVNEVVAADVSNAQWRQLAR